MNDQEVIRIEGGNPLYGELYLQGSKNATLPVLAACLLIDGKIKIRNCPIISDVSNMLKIMQHVGCVVLQKEHELDIDASSIVTSKLPGKIVKQMRSSILMMGALLARTGEVGIDYPGGCVLGDRPIDLHINAMKELGARIQVSGDYLIGNVDELRGASVLFPFPSVGATQNAILAACLAKGDTYIYPAAKEPEVIALCEFLKAAGADITGEGTSLIQIKGVDRLHEVEYVIPGDRIVAGTYLFCTMGTRGRVCLKNAPVEHLNNPIEVMEKMGAKVKTGNQEIEVFMEKQPQNLTYVETGAYPEFPTDLQSSLLALACISGGATKIHETIFSNRFRICEELIRMGADVTIEDNMAQVTGTDGLVGRNVIARELRGGAALVAAGLSATGITTVVDAGYIKRGYEDIVGDFKSLGAKITMVP